MCQYPPQKRGLFVEFVCSGDDYHAPRECGDDFAPRSPPTGPGMAGLAPTWGCGHVAKTCRHEWRHGTSGDARHLAFPHRTLSSPLLSSLLLFLLRRNACPLRLSVRKNVCPLRLSVCIVAGGAGFFGPLGGGGWMNGRNGSRLPARLVHGNM